MVDKVLADKLATLAVSQIRIGNRYKRGRMKQIREREAMYLLQTPPALPGRFNVPPIVMGGFIDSLMSKLNSPIKINFKKQEEADLKKAAKTQAMWERDSAPTRGKWRMKDLLGKKLAALSGVAIYYTGAEASPNYKSVFENVLHHHFYCEPKKGYDLEDHLFLGRMNVWRTESQLNVGAEKGRYDKEQVAKLIASFDDKNTKTNEELFIEDQNLYKALGLDATQNYTGEKVFCLTTHYMVYEGKRYYVFIDYSTGIWISALKLTEMISPPSMEEEALWPFGSWHTHPDLETFWSKAPSDDIAPIAETIRVIINYALENLKKRTRKKRAIDPEIFPDISQIEDDTSETVETNTMAQGKQISQGVYEFQTEDNTQIIVNLVGFFKNFAGTETGVTPGSQGNSKEQTATVYVGNIQQVANRMSLYSDFYRQFWAETGLRYFIGLKDKLTEKIFVQVLGLTGLEWEEMKEDDVNPIRDFDIMITGGEEETILMQQKSKEKNEALKLALTHYKEKLNPDWAVAEILKAGGYTDEEVLSARDLDVYGGAQILSEAAEAIQSIVKGKIPKKNGRATLVFMMKLFDFANDHEEDLKKDQYENLLAYAYIHLDIIIRNTRRRAMLLATTASLSQLTNPQGPGPGQIPAPQSIPERTPGIPQRQEINAGQPVV